VGSCPWLGTTVAKRNVIAITNPRIDELLCLLFPAWVIMLE
jgi:hypothetical protein